MTMAAAIESRTADAPAWSGPTRIATVDILSDLSCAEAVWRQLENPQHFSTPFQRYDFLDPWQRLTGAREGGRPFVVVAYDHDNQPLLLLPLTLGQAHGICTARFMGGKHSTFNMALWNRDFAKDATRADIDTLISAIRARAEADVLAFSRQPLAWQDLANPMALLPHQPSPNDCPVMTLAPDASADTRISLSMRRRLKTKERKLHALPGYRYHVAGDDGDINRLLDAFFKIKPQRMAKQKLPNVFTEPGVETFIREVCLRPLTGSGRIVDIHALECDREVIAVFAGVADGQRFSMMFNTYTVSENSRFSPGLILIRHIADHYAERGYRSLDLGVGRDHYKRLFCKGNEPIFDCFIPVSLRGSAAAAAMSAANRAKHLVKHNSTLLSLAQVLQRAML